MGSSESPGSAEPEEVGNTREKVDARRTSADLGGLVPYVTYLFLSALATNWVRGNLGQRRRIHVQQ